MLVGAIVSVVNDEDSEQSEPQRFSQTDPRCVRGKHISTCGPLISLRGNCALRHWLCVVLFHSLDAVAQCLLAFAIFEFLRATRFFLRFSCRTRLLVTSILYDAGVY